MADTVRCRFVGGAFALLAFFAPRAGWDRGPRVSCARVRARASRTGL